VFKTSPKTSRKFPRLAEILAGKSRLLIVTQDNPDPDAIAAAVALRKLANVLADIKCSLAHAGTIGRGENRALVRYLDLNLHQLSGVSFEQFDLVALVDTQPTSGNLSLPPQVMPDIVFDHHPCRKATRQVRFSDVRKDYGAACTILWEYLVQANITPEAPLATAMLYGIGSDTQDLGREATAADIQAYEALYPLVNKRMLSQIQRGTVPSEYYRLLVRALQRTTVYDERVVVAHLGLVDNPDMIGEMADLLLRKDQTEWTLCTGQYNGKLWLSIRTQDPANRADLRARHIVARHGTGGGHLTYAGGQIPIKDGHKGLEHMEQLVCRRLLRMLGVDHLKAKPLIKADDGP
jgi:nanoRNase/pAp phosphatase (c-di-AMP/oligoRNAs hydrolase)